MKEQTAGLYAQEMAGRGFVTLAFDPSYTGESGGQPCNIAFMDTFLEDFSAAVDFLGTRPFVDRNRIGVIGVCASGGFAVNAAQIDPRLKAIATVSMYDMGRATREGLGLAVTPSDVMTKEEQIKALEEAAEQRWIDFEGGQIKYGGVTSVALKPTWSNVPIKAIKCFIYITYIMLSGVNPLRYDNLRVAMNIIFLIVK